MYPKEWRDISWWDLLPLCYHSRGYLPGLGQQVQSCTVAWSRETPSDPIFYELSIHNNSPCNRPFLRESARWFLRSRLQGRNNLIDHLTLADREWTSLESSQFTRVKHFVFHHRTPQIQAEQPVMLAFPCKSTFDSSRVNEIVNNTVRYQCALTERSRSNWTRAIWWANLLHIILGRFVSKKATAVFMDASSDRS